MDEWYLFIGLCIDSQFDNGKLSGAQGLADRVARLEHIDGLFEDAGCHRQVVCGGESMLVIEIVMSGLHVQISM